MESKSLKVIQVIAKIAKVVSKIVFILSIVGAAGCLTGILSFVLIPGEIEIGDVTIHQMIENNSGMSVGDIYAAMISGCLLCMAEIAIAKMSYIYFTHEVEAGTPFTRDGAKEIRTLGIAAAAISLGTAIIISITMAIIKGFYPDLGELKIDGYSSVGTGLFYIFLSFVFMYGAEVSESSKMVEEKEEDVISE